MNIPILDDIVIIFLLSVIVIYIFNKFKIPAIIGFLLTGVLIGPNGLSLIKSTHEVEILAEIGVILFLFSIGIEFSISKLSKMKKVILLGGGFQVITTILVFYAVSLIYGLGVTTSIFIGFLTSLSSTAIILKLIQTKGLLGSPQGNTSIGILLFQDIAILPMFLFIPLLSGSGGDLITESGILLLKVAGIILFLFLSIKYIVPNLLHSIAKTRIKELFYVTIFLICFLVVLLASSLGISLALGAFLAGLIISETDFNHEALGIIEPFRDVFTSFFFVSVGMLLNINIVLEFPKEIIGLTLLIIIIKSLIAGTSVLILKFPMRIAVLTSISLAQIGEFSFVLSKFGLDYNLIENGLYQKFLAIAIITMSLTPFLFNVAPKVVSLLKIRDKKPQDSKAKKRLADLLIIGYGLNGRNIAQAARNSGISYNILEMNPETVKQEKAKNENIMYGDASNENVLHNAGIEKARICVIVISDTTSIKKIIHKIREINPGIYLIVRTRYISEMDNFFKIGADEVIPEEFETSIEIVARVMNRFLIPKQEIDDFIEKMRKGHYDMFRNIDYNNNIKNYYEIHTEHEIRTVKIPENSELLKRSLEDSDFRKIFRTNILAIRRDDKVITNPPGDTLLLENDEIILFGTPDDINKACSKIIKK